MSINISLRQLNVFATITQHKTLTKASEHLFLSKAAVSMALSELEKQIGHTLFDRVNNRLILNHEGQRLLPLADELLHRAKDIEDLLHNSDNLSGLLRIGASDTVGNQVIPYLLSGFRAETNHHSQSVFISNTARICQQLVDYELDIALIEGETPHPDLIATQFSQDEMCIVCSPKHPLAKKKSLTLNDLDNNQWVLREAGSGTREFFLKTVVPHFDQWQESFQLNTTEAIINSVSADLGLSCLSKLAVNAALADGRLTELRIPLDMKRKFWLLLHKEKYENPLLARFIKYCHQWDKERS